MPLLITPWRKALTSVSGLTSSGKAKSGAHRTVSSLEETDAANFFAAAGEYINSAKSPFFLWLHTDTLGRIWDAPLEYRQQYTDEDDPTSGNWADVPNRTLPDTFDPDERVAIAHAYAGQVTAIDQLLGVLLDEIESAGVTESTLVALFSPRGFPLGEHKRIGPCDEALYVELTHVPCVLRLPGGECGRPALSGTDYNLAIFRLRFSICWMSVLGQVRQIGPWAAAARSFH